MNIKTVGFQVLKPEVLTKVQFKLDDAEEFLHHKIGEFDELSVTLKELHKTTQDTHPIYELIINLVRGANITHAKAEDRDVIVAVDKALEVIKSTAVKK